MASGMTKTQLVRHMAEKLETNNKTAATFLDTLAETAIKETKKSGIFVIPGLGQLVKANRKARMGRNPQTGEPIKIASKSVVKFRLTKSVKDSIGGSVRIASRGGKEKKPPRTNFPGPLINDQE